MSKAVRSAVTKPPGPLKVYRPLEYPGENMQVKAFNVIPL